MSERRAVCLVEFLVFGSLAFFTLGVLTMCFSGTQRETAKTGDQLRRIQAIQMVMEQLELDLLADASAARYEDRDLQLGEAGLSLAFYRHAPEPVGPPERVRYSFDPQDRRLRRNGRPFPAPFRSVKFERCSAPAQSPELENAVLVSIETSDRPAWSSVVWFGRRALENRHPDELPALDGSFRGGP